jgi:predicted transcriptional regulator
MKRQSIPTYPNLKTWRRTLRLNQREAALLLGISQTHYCRLERGVYAPKRDVLKRLMAKTGVPIEVLVGVA